MKFHVLSDLHVDHRPFFIEPTDADVLVLAGDTCGGTAGLDLVTPVRDQYAHVIVVAGNHEYYGHAIPRLDAKLRDCASDVGATFLQCDRVEIDGVHVLGCTLWTDFEVGRPEVTRAAAIASAESAMMDFSRIRVAPEYRRLRSSDVLRLHCRHREWLERELDALVGEPTVVVTHHAPHPRSIAAQHAGSPLNGAFASDLESLMVRAGVSLWIHGHTHHCVAYEIGRTRVVSNQRGYPGEDAGEFDPALVVEV